ncbi:phospho-2-dehydro-3-deoxyheptonate aldolase,related [Neospora caninum Liverpool]|uniref:Phospho-2-dehydro-3-deoxyheptonate aldolase n=1 Tax=Neospora caninum (strain Liverpool) TaxID=572307 RepID=F0V8G5_NEOCL|nr:phospho-2-dehydro-3-deoxyheptonate aldolase,related [Neospora caninum Liverpool]CBZ50006.1 phospho-2-dehydro-3-deoxyheptonate aldolase,related [Neospora caninum Liverpool]|eukprot:XP_003880041.1 phospho-2-dehydro-3-deoxyheptonate aldolase,related [Neospora caninum Liverpool]
MLPSRSRCCSSERHGACRARQADPPERICTAWSPSCWQNFPAAQNPFATLPSGPVVSIQRRLRLLPPLVSAHEIEGLLSQLKDVYEGKRFVLQGGDCAEVFADCQPCILAAKMRLLLQMSLILQDATSRKIVRIGRMAGQYGKPRSRSHEILEGRKVLTYRGDSVNGTDPSDRDPQPERLLQAYFQSAATLNFVRSLLSPGSSFFRADTGSEKTEESVWELSKQVGPERRREFQILTNTIAESKQRPSGPSLAMHASHSSSASSYTTSPPSSPKPSDLESPSPLFSSRPPFSSLLDSADTDCSIGCFSSHEALLLPYEEAMTREYDGKFYDTSAHFLWIGDRTRQLDHAHIQFCRGIRNSIGVKVGPTAQPHEIVDICRILNPENIPGKVVLITRLGAADASRLLPPVIEAVQTAGVRVVWLCDPMHGNTQVTPEGKKRRCFTDMLKEVLVTFDTHVQHQSQLGGVHFELTGEHVSECIGGCESRGKVGDEETYEAFCDPRLNYTQAVEMAFEIASHIKHADQEQGRSVTLNNWANALH